MAMSCEHSSTEYPAWLRMSIRYNGGACQRIQRIIQNKRTNLQLIVCEVTFNWPRNFAAPYLIVPGIFYMSWWRHQLETFSALLAFCAGNSPASQRPMTRSFGVFFDLRLNQQLSKQWRRRWFKTPSCPLWRHCNVIYPGPMPLLTGRFAAKLGASGHRGHFSFE